MPKKFYVVWKGRRTGVFSDWKTCQEQIDKFTGARYKSYKTRAEAETAFRGGAAAALAAAKAAKAAKPAGGKSRGGPYTHSAAEVAAEPSGTKIFTDGGCEPNPGQAASGVAVYRDGAVAELWYGLYNPRGTNNTAELNALHQALLMAEQEVAASRSVAIFCDSQYAIQCVTKWAAGWEKNGWKKKDGEIRNLEVIQRMHRLYSGLKSAVKVLHVNGHVGVEGNELADRMSIHGIDRKEESFTRFDVPADLKTVLKMRTG